MRKESLKLRAFRCLSCPEVWSDHRRRDAVRCPVGHLFCRMVSDWERVDRTTYDCARFLLADGTDADRLAVSLGRRLGIRDLLGV